MLIAMVCQTLTKTKTVRFDHGGTDCNDYDATINPNSPTTPQNIDTTNGSIDEGVVQMLMRGFTNLDGDCNTMIPASIQVLQMFMMVSIPIVLETPITTMGGKEDAAAYGGSDCDDTDIISIVKPSVCRQ